MALRAVVFITELSVNESYRSGRLIVIAFREISRTGSGRPLVVGFRDTSGLSRKNSD